MTSAPDAAVVGAGIVGCALAAFLAEAGCSVLLVERDDVGAAAGHGPWGISLGPASARLVADLVLGRAADPVPAFDPARF